MSTEQNPSAADEENVAGEKNVPDEENVACEESVPEEVSAAAEDCCFPSAEDCCFLDKVKGGAGQAFEKAKVIGAGAKDKAGDLASAAKEKFEEAKAEGGLFDKMRDRAGDAREKFDEKLAEAKAEGGLFDQVRDRAEVAWDKTKEVSGQAANKAKELVGGTRGSTDQSFDELDVTEAADVEAEEANAEPDDATDGAE